MNEKVKKPTQIKKEGHHRIAKAIADAGYTSRRQAEQLISQRRVRVNNEWVDHPSLLVSRRDIICIDDVPLNSPKEISVWKFYKPRGLITTHKDTHARTTVFEFIKNKFPHLERTISVGRLDLMSEGLLLLTNSGDFAQYTQDPATSWIRKYHVRIYGTLTASMSETMCKGIMIKGKCYRLQKIESSPSFFDKRSQNQWVTVSLLTGKNREIRELFKVYDIKISRLIRLSYGPFHLDDLSPGDLKKVSPAILRHHLPPSLLTP